MDNSVSKHLKHNQSSHAGKKRGGSGAKASADNATPKVSGSKKQIDASTKKVVDLIRQDKGEETAKRLEPIVKETFKQFYSGDVNKPLVVNGNKVTNQDRDVTALDMLNSLADRFGVKAVTGISEADFSSGAAFRNTVGKSSVVKHARHNQQSHANKKRGGSKKKRRTKRISRDWGSLFRHEMDLKEAGRAEVEKYNPYHDRRGRFTSAMASATMSFLRGPKLAAIGGLPRNNPRNQPKPITEKKRKYLRGIDAAKQRRFKLKREQTYREQGKELPKETPSWLKHLDVVGKANPYKDKEGRFTTKEKAVAIVPQRMTPQNAPTKLAGKMVQDGGFTFDAKKSQLRRKGFAVSTVKGAEQMVPLEEFKRNGEKIVKGYLQRNSEEVAKPRMHLGGWYERQTGKVYLDISKVVGDVQEAANLGRQHDQIAFFDLATFTTWRRFPTTKGLKYVPEASRGGEGYVTAPIVGTIPTARGIELGKAEAVEGVIFCPVDSLLDDESIRKFVEQVMATTISKADPTSYDVHVPTIMGNKKRKTKKLKKSELVVKKAKLKDPKGGLTAAGRAHFNRTTGSNLKPGVKGKADTPEKMRRKGSFLTRFFTNPSGPMKDEKGRPTRLALSAAAWGEPVPSDRAAAARLAQKGRNLLERYENQKKKVSKFNPYHDERGRFTSANSATGGSRGGGLMDAYVSDYERRIGRNAKNRAANEQKNIQRRIEQKKRKEAKAKEEARRNKIRIQQKNKKLKLRRRKRR